MLSLEVSTPHLVEAAGILSRFLQNSDPDIRFVSLSLFLQVESGRRCDADGVYRRHHRFETSRARAELSPRRRPVHSTSRAGAPHRSRASQHRRNHRLRAAAVSGRFFRGVSSQSEVVDSEERRDGISKVTSLVQQFAPSAIWQVDTLLELLKLNGDSGNEEVLSTLVDVVSHEDDTLACYTVWIGCSTDSKVHALFNGVQKERSQIAFVQTVLWFIGEYGDLLLEPFDSPSSASQSASNRKKQTPPPIHFDPVQPSQLLDLLRDLQQDGRYDEETQMLLLTAVLKLADRLNTGDADESSELSELQKIVEGFQASQSLELAQRASE